ncbi:putative transcription factor interactor and regulator CCHC(Zn) family [Helianthus anomalus]
MGLNPSYDVVRGTILMMQPLPSINQAYALLIQDEKQREISSAAQFSTESASMHVNSQFQGTMNGNFENKKHLVCSHCKKNGHTASKCYRLVGFPKDFKFTKPKRGAANMAFEDDSDPSSHSESFITTEQYNDLMKLLQKAQLTKEPAEIQPTTTVSHANFAGLICS